MKSLLMGLVFTAFLGGCATRPNVNIAAPFDETSTSAQLRPGSNSIKGSALFRQQGGGVVTCAGFPIHLFPATSYSRERIAAIYGSAEGGLSPVYAPQPIFNPDPAAYKTLIKETRCDAQGFFKFENLADGDYYIQSGIAWRVGYAVQGGTITSPVTVKNSEIKDIVLAR